MRQQPVIAIALLLMSSAIALAQETTSPPVVIDPPVSVAPSPAPRMVVEEPELGINRGDSEILTIDQEDLFSTSLWGKRVHAGIEQESQNIAKENERLATEFSDEEQQLTQLRATLAPDEFRKRADEFDKRVVEVRRQRDSVARELQEQIEAERAGFFRAVLPVLAQVMKERGAVVVLDQRSVFVSAQSIDITEFMVERLNREFGAGPAATPQAPTEP